MFELRVLSGLHRGAALPLVGDEWIIGASDGADLALYDPGICDRHLRVSGGKGGWTLERLDGVLSDAKGERIDRLDSLPLGLPFAVAGIWLCLVQAEQPWPDDAALDEASCLGGAEQNTLQPTAVPARPSWPKRIAIAVGIVTLGSSAWALTTGTDETPALRQASVQAAAPTRIRLDNARDVARELERMLRERELSAYVRVDVRPDRVVLSGGVPRQQLGIAARMVDRFNERYETSVSISEALHERKVELPFQIVQIVGGKHGHVVTSSGQRLFLGDQIGGLRLTAIDKNTVSFEGDQRYEVTW